MKNKSLNPQNPLICVILVLTFLTACSRTYHEQSYEYPAWTPDGKIVYWYGDYTTQYGSLLSNLESVQGHTELRIMDADGSNDKKLFDRPQYGSHEMSISPDGTKILNGGQILNFQTGEELAKNEDVTPGDWSPDGKKIVFVKGTIKIWDVSSNVVTDTGLEGENPNWKYNEYFLYGFVSKTLDWTLNQANINGEIITTFNYGDGQYIKTGDYFWYLGKERQKIFIKDKSIALNYTVDSVANQIGSASKLSPDGTKVIWNTTETSLVKSIWIENIDGTGRTCLKQGK